jgi:hypothetical protein
MAKAKAADTKIISRLLSATPEQAKDTGMAMVLICLLLGHFYKIPKLFPVSIVLLLLTMAWPKAFKPLAGLWFGLSQVMGQVVSKILLTLAFFLIVTPIGLIRRLTGADPLQLKKWKQGTDSVFVERQGAIQDKDLLNPF